MKFDLTLSERKHMRIAYGKALVELGKEHPNMVVLDADLSESTMTCMFAKEFPERFFNVGCAEQNLMGMSAGFALEGKTVFTSAFAMFGCGRAWEQIRNTIAYDRLNVKIVLTHAGLTVGKDGSSHQIIEDLSLMRVIPGMHVMVPADALEAEYLVKSSIKYHGPVYIRLSREKTPVIFKDYDFDLHKPITIIDGDDVTLAACGVMVSEAIKAAQELEKQKIRAKVINVNTIKPIHKESIIQSAKETGAIVTAEEHSIYGGLGSAVAEVLVENYPVPMKRIGVVDRFGKSGEPYDLMAEYNITAKDIVEAAKEVIKRKK
ncbi:MAG: transketolase family protein [Candidatus Altiarchaeota archaeon]|nr:transketolase family protein [Candidatus Altiarchaeota archaeon]